MIDRRITIPFIFIIAAAVILAVSISDPFDIATANSGVKMIENKAEVLQESNVQAITENTLEIEESGEVFEETKDIVELRAILIKKINATLLHPGWVKVRIEKSDFTYEENFIEIPEKNIFIPINKIEEYWILVDDNCDWTALYNQSHTSDGKEYLTYLVSNGKKWNAIQAELLEEASFSQFMNIQLINDIIALGYEKDAKIEYLTEFDKEVVVVSFTLEMASPTVFGGLEKENVTSVTTSNYYDWETGVINRVEQWITFIDGSKMQSSLVELQSSKYTEIPDEVLKSINELGE